MEIEEQNVKRHKKYEVAKLSVDGTRHLHEFNEKLHEKEELIFYDNLKAFRMKL